MNLFYYTKRKKVEEGEEMELIIETGNSFQLDSVFMTYPTKTGLAVVLDVASDRLNPTEYKYRMQNGQKVPVGVAKYEILNEPIVIELTVEDEILQFYKLTGGPSKFTPSQLS
jgi:hypothetical protein